MATERVPAVSAPVLVELCAGTASVSLWALGRAAPLCGFMGSKRRWASVLAEALGVAHAPPERVVLVDAGPWGDVWATMRDPELRELAAAQFDLWADEDPVELWEYLATQPPADAPHGRAAQYLWLQARSPGVIPIWWSGSRWEHPTGATTESAHQRGGWKSNQKQSPGARGCRGMVRPGNMAARIRALEALDWSRVEVIHGDVRAVDPIPGAVALFDPPYLGSPRYAELLPRADVLNVARRHAEAGARVAVCESGPLAELDGWTSRPLPSARKPEWVTASWPIALPEQLDLLLSRVEVSP